MRFIVRVLLKSAIAVGAKTSCRNFKRYKSAAPLFRRARDLGAQRLFLNN